MNDAEKEVRDCLDRLAHEKMGLQAQLADIKNQCKVHLPNKLYATLMGQRAPLVKRLGEIELGLSTKRRELKAILSEEDIGQHEKPYLVRMVREVRDKYQDVAAGEHDHGPSERLLAAQVVRDLNPIMQRLLRPS